MTRVMLVTGASGSIGRVVAQRAAAEGWSVIAHGRSAASADAAVKAVRAAFPDASVAPLHADFTVEGAVPAALGTIADTHGRLDAVAHCAVSAPAGVTGAFARTEPAAFTMFCHHAITTLQWLCHAAFPLMTRGGGGAFVALASDAGRFAAPNQSLVGATRAAMMAFVRNVSLEVARDGIRVNCVSSSFVEETAIVAALEAAGNRRVAAARARAGLGLPDAGDMAALILFLLGTGSTRITGQVISVNGGLNS